MTKLVQHWGKLLLLFCVPAIAVAQNPHYESITFLGSDGTQYVNYTTTRSDAPSYTLHLDKDRSLEDFLYINPHNFEFDNTQAENNRIVFPQGDYAVISQGDLASGTIPQVTLDAEGIYTLKTWDGHTLANKHFGYWNTPDNFSNFAAAWVFPDHFKVIDYLSNKPGEWKQRGNALAFFAEDQNDLTFEIRYSATTQEIYAALQKEFGDVEAVDITQSAESVTLTFANEILFASGSAAVSDAGSSVIAEIAMQLAAAEQATAFTLVVAGHTDDRPISGTLAQRYATNWELSAARSLNVVHALIKAGIEPAILESRAYADQQPRVANDSSANRRSNRRTEIKILPN